MSKWTHRPQTRSQNLPPRPPSQGATEASKREYKEKEDSWSRRSTSEQTKARGPQGEEEAWWVEIKLSSTGLWQRCLQELEAEGKPGHANTLVGKLDNLCRVWDRIRTLNKYGGGGGGGDNGHTATKTISYKKTNKLWEEERDLIFHGGKSTDEAQN